VRCIKYVAGLGEFLDEESREDGRTAGAAEAIEVILAHVEKFDLEEKLCRNLIKRLRVFGVGEPEVVAHFN
jgi:hypothetical protein